MAPRATDKTICRYCRLKEPAIILKHIKGKPIGECKTCNNNRQLDNRRRLNFAQGFYSTRPELVAVNLRTLEGLMPGAYALSKRTTKAQAGYIVIQERTIYVNIWNEGALFRYTLFEMASYLGNLNLFLDAKPITILDAQGTSLALETIGEGMPLLDVTERLVWFDPALLGKAIAIVRAEIEAAKRATAEHARRSNNPIPKPDAS